jgi:hypothetical protein
MATSPFRSPAEFREIVDRTLTIASRDDEMGPRLRAADAPQRFEFTDVGLVLHIRASEPGEDGCLIWAWGDEAGWAPRTRMTLTSEVANRCLLGEETVAMAMARRRIRAAGDVAAALALVPVIQPIFERYRAMVTEDYPHLTTGG